MFFAFYSAAAVVVVVVVLSSVLTEVVVVVWDEVEHPPRASAKASPAVTIRFLFTMFMGSSFHIVK